MQDEVKMVKACYNEDASQEWARLERHPVEFAITRKFIDRYVKHGDRVLDIGGGPGRYSFYLAEKGCDVTLFDLSDENVKFASERAVEQGLNIKTVCGDACEVDKLVNGQFDHVLLMGPLYHLPNEADRVKTVNAALGLLKPGGVLFSAFISSYASVWDSMASYPNIVLDEISQEFFNHMLNDTDFSGVGFTQNHFIRPTGVAEFMAKFPLEKLHIAGCESILALRTQELMKEPPEVFQKWLEFAFEVCEREEFLGMSHHLLHVGRNVAC